MLFGGFLTPPPIVSIRLRHMKGPHDHSIKWPFPLQ
jgi:hypothetical protein